MNTTEKQLIEKQRELITYLNDNFWDDKDNHEDNEIYRMVLNKLHSEISALEQQLLKEIKEPALSAEEWLKNKGFINLDDSLKYPFHGITYFTFEMVAMCLNDFNKEVMQEFGT